MPHISPKPPVTPGTVIAVVLVVALYIIPILAVASFFIDMSNAMAGL